MVRDIIERFDEFFGIYPYNKNRRTVMGVTLSAMATLFYLLLMPKLLDTGYEIPMLFLYSLFLSAVLYYVLLPWKNY